MIGKLYKAIRNIGSDSEREVTGDEASLERLMRDGGMERSESGERDLMDFEDGDRSRPQKSNQSYRFRVVEDCLHVVRMLLGSN